MPRTFWSRWTVLILALVASLTSPVLAVAHGVAHAHGAEEHAGDDHDRRAAHDHDHDHDHEHEPVHGHEHASAPSHDEHGATLRDQHHGHRHDHARVELGATGKPDGRSVFEVPVTATVAPPMLAEATHERSPVSRWDIVTLARPAPDTGPPPALRAPPVR